MWKYFIRISSVTILLLGVLFFINKTNAQTALLSLKISGLSISDCTIATGIDLGTKISSGLVQSLSGNAWVGPDFGCTDLKGDTGWNFTIYSTILTGTPTGTIPASNITLTPSGAITVTSGYCPSIHPGPGGTLDTTRNLITKTNGYGQICSFYLSNTQININVIIPAWSPVGTYSSILTIVYPS